MAALKITWASWLLFPSLFLGLVIPTSIADPEVTSQAYVYALCPDMTTVAPSSKYQTNINTLLSYLSANSSNKNLIFNTTVGSEADKIYGLFFCRIDVTVAVCQKCVLRGIEALKTRCPRKKSSIVWYFDQCVVRYSNQSFLGTMNDAPMIPMWNRENTLDIWNVSRNMNDFMEVVLTTLDRAAEQASSGPLHRKFATKEATFGANLTKLNKLYVLTECTPDISLADCRECLKMVISNTTGLCNEKAGCTLMCPNCNMRYDIHPFYGDAGAVFSGPSWVPSSEGHNTQVIRRKRAIVIGATAAVALAMASVFGVWICIFKRKSRESPADLNDIESAESLKIDFNTIRSATNNFAEDKKLGEGGFGEVFKGKLENGQEVAVKRLSRDSRQGIEEFKTEILLVAKLQHRNLVKLLGFCVEKTEKLLVYEFLPNLSLDQFLFDPAKCASLDWDTRYKIICGIARGLLYLHEDSRLKIIHRDLKSSNVLLDKDMNPKISDFGMARLFGIDETQRNTGRIAGTFGYMAPEYVITGQFSAKSDVYSFGMIVLEIVSGQKNKFCSQSHDEESLIHRAWRLWNVGIALELVDPTLGKKFSPDEVAKCIHIGLLCVQEDASKRPRMATVVAALNGDSIILPLPTAAHFFIAGAFEGFGESEVDQCATSLSSTQNITVMDPR